MPETSALEVRRMRLSRRVLIGALVAAGVLLVGTTGGIVAGVHWWGEAGANDALRLENDALRAQLEALDDRFQGVDKVVSRLKQFDAKLRALTMVSDPDRNLAMGPVGAPSSNIRDAADEAASDLRRDLLSESSERSLDVLKSRAELVEREAMGTSASVESLSVFLEGQRALLAATPSRRPVRGYVSSDYGMRVDPFTGLPQMHAGVDFSANIGEPVVATADGVVIFAGAHGAYGNTVEIEHRSGLVSKFSHLSRIHLKVGENVTRGEPVGTVGNTGRSTGPHLHYEIRLSGLPVDPNRYLLE